MLNLIRRFWPARTGNIAMITALLMVPLVGIGGGALDIGRLQMVHSRLQDAADAASVGSVAKTSASMTAAALMTGDGNVAAGSTLATNIFNANMAAISNVTISNQSAVVTKTGQVISAQVTAQASMPTYFMRIIGISSMITSAKSVSSNSLPTFIDFYLLLDNTPSMGVGATPADVATMVAHTPDQCAFACHDINPGATDNYYALAKTLSVTTRIDVLRSATQSLMTTAQSTETVPNQFRMAIATFGASSAAPGYYPLAAPTSNLTTAQTTAGSIDLMTVPGQNFNNDQDTDFASAMTGANSAIPTPGTGASAASPQKVLFLISDGVNDSNIGGNRVISTIDPSYCSTIKNRGVKIAVLYTTYLPLPTNTFYVNNVAPFVNTINPTMQSCASPGYFFEVSPTDGVASAMAALFQKAVANAHITQ